MTTGVSFGNAENISLVTAVVDVASVAAATTVQQTATVLGVQVGDFVTAAPSTFTAGLNYGACIVTAANTVAITVTNASAGALDPASQTFTFLVVRSETLPVKNIVSD